MFDRIYSAQLRLFESSGSFAAGLSEASDALSEESEGAEEGSWVAEGSRSKYLPGDSYVPKPPNIPPLRALWSVLDGIWAILKGSWGVLVVPFWVAHCNQQVMSHNHSLFWVVHYDPTQNSPQPKKEYIGVSRL